MTEYKPKSEFLQTIIERGFFHDCTDLEALDKKLMQEKPMQKTAYIGFDATADSLHVGSLMQIMMLRWFQKCGHSPIVLMGGGTTKVGDPSGKDESRQLLDNETIDKNIKGIMDIFDNYIKLGHERSVALLGKRTTDAIQSNNAEWLDKLNYVEFLRDIGRHFTINRMMTMDSVKTRLEREQPLTFLEFNYMLLQSYDFLRLHKRERCILQIGGSDQWGNIVNGVDLVRRVTGNQVFGLTSPLITKADGSKMGKTASGAIWLDSFKTSPYDFWQFWRNTLDEDVGKFLKIFTELPIEECNRLGAFEDERINDAKIILATEVCALCHGREAAEKAKATAKAVFDEGGVGSELEKIHISSDNFNKLVLSAVDKGDGHSTDVYINLVGLLVEIKFAASGKEAKRHITSGAVRIGNQVMTETSYYFIMLQSAQLKVSLGKKRHALVDFKCPPLSPQ
ncbi:MAG: tyrosine--tRNA ligase [Proteobacteria bacterium]|nr:tyrosine--tRNA ligase [Pseudomonadota bacterium]